MLTEAWSVVRRDYFTARALSESIPHRAVVNRCRTWGIGKGRAVQIAEDASSEAFLRSISCSYFSEEHFRAWLTRAALNFATDVLRREKRLRNLTNEDDLPEKVELRDGDSEELGICVRSLPHKDQMILKLSYELGYTLDQIADELNIEPSASKNARRLRVKRMRDSAIAIVTEKLERLGYQDSGFLGGSHR